MDILIRINFTDIRVSMHLNNALEINKLNDIDHSLSS